MRFYTIICLFSDIFLPSCYTYYMLISPFNMAFAYNKDLKI